MSMKLGIRYDQKKTTTEELLLCGTLKTYEADFLLTLKNYLVI